MSNNDIIRKIIGNNKRFRNPYDEPQGYYIVDSVYMTNEEFSTDFINLYYKKLRYAVHHSDDLIKSAFDDRFYSFYGVDRTLVNSPAQIIECDTCWSGNRENNMNMEERISRINELYHKSQAEGLSDEERDEQARLRKEYVANIRANLKGHLDSITIQHTDGSKEKLSEKYGDKKQSNK